MSFGRACYRCGKVIPANSICSCIIFGQAREHEKDMIERAACPI